MIRRFIAVLALLLIGLGCGDDGGGGDSSTVDSSVGTDGGVGDACTYTDECAEGLYCAPNRTCQPAGSGTSGDECALDGDCERGLVCDSVGGALRCVAPLTGDVGDPCDSVIDCRAGLFCVAGRCSAEMGGTTDAGPMDGGADGGDAGGDGGPPPPPPTCLAYCGLVIANCESAAQYGSFAECMGHCETSGGWEVGTRGDDSGNTLACRTTHAERAGADPGANCVAAGPSGGNVCGNWCTVYCAQVATNCTGGESIAFDPDCVTECAGYPADGPPNAPIGDSVQCRIYHSGAPAGGDPGMHCPHAAPDGGGVCEAP